MVFWPRKKDISAGLLNSILMNFWGCFGSVAINGLTMNFDFTIYELFLCHLNDLGYRETKKTYRTEV